MDKNKSSFQFSPIISSVQKIALYETKSYFYLMGSNNSMSRFRVLKIDRLESKELLVLDDKKEHSQDEIKILLNKIDNANQTDPVEKSSINGAGKIISAFGIIGFVRFMEGYYIILVTKRRRISVIGNHTIYKIEDTSMVYIPNESARCFHPDEQKYVKMFQSIDLSSNFYFSYSFDITHSLQYNMIPVNSSQTDIKFNEESKKTIYCGIRNKPHERFVWNSHLLAPIREILHNDWILYIIHGFIGQSNVSVFGKSMYITLIARRSNRYAGTRFLKRGANIQGDVANEVETEQIVHDSSITNLKNGGFSSFVQMRGSVPSLWSQDVSKMVPKPSIAIDLSDPFTEISGAHLNRLLHRYGSPIIVLNLLKTRETRKHESILSEEFNVAIKYLNQFLPTEHHIQYFSFDMARKNKGKQANVMGRLANIANSAVLKTKIFLSLPKNKDGKKLLNEIMSSKKSSKSESSYNLQSSSLNDSIISNSFGENVFLQTGIIRTNCVDCLDRTNTAQFAIGKCALGFQLCALGVLESPKLEFDSDCVRMLEELYEDHGDTLALQYGGSQLVHRIKTYRKTAPWTSQGNDIMQTLSRYYSNTFSDQEKQHTMNLFLGLYVPDRHKNPIWDLLTDHHLHNKSFSKIHKEKKKLLTQWWDQDTFDCLPHSLYEKTKSYLEIMKPVNVDNEIIDVYYDYYRPFELCWLNNVYAYEVSHSVRDFMPHFTTNFSPFIVRVRPGKRREETSNKNSFIKNPSLTGQSSTSSTASSDSSTADSSSDGDESQQITESKIIPRNHSEVISEWYYFLRKDIYQVKPKNPKRNDIRLYKKSVLIDKNATNKDYDSSKFVQPFNNKEKKCYNFNLTINSRIYEDHLIRVKSGGLVPNASNLSIYEKYIQQKISKNKFMNFTDCYNSRESL